MLDVNKIDQGDDGLLRPHRGGQSCKDPPSAPPSSSTQARSSKQQTLILNTKHWVRVVRSIGSQYLLKDNIATRASDGMNTTSGSYAPLGSIPPQNLTVIAKLRAAGAVLLGQANLSEWAHFRGVLPPGFSGRGGQCPYFPIAERSGSSSGAGIASAIGLAAAAQELETDGSIFPPSSRQNLVGIKPAVGLTIIDLSCGRYASDTVGSMARSVVHAAIILTTIAGRDPLDNFTLLTLQISPGYRGKTLSKVDPNIDRAFDASQYHPRGRDKTYPTRPSCTRLGSWGADGQALIQSIVSQETITSRIIRLPEGVEETWDIGEGNTGTSTQYKCIKE
ncbi:amidase signature domain-containing protein [Lactarius indigo]|nr:amidase signature domain-containing protein [Lactarius indigo]